MTLTELKNTVENYFKVDLTIKNRKTFYLFTRYSYFYLALKYVSNHLSLENIAKEIDLKSHATVMNGLKEFNSILNYNQQYKTMFVELENIIKEKSKEIVEDNIFIDSLDELKIKRKIQNLKYKNRKQILRYKNLKQNHKRLKNELAILRRI